MEYLQKFLDTPKDEKWWQKDSEIKEELNDVPMFENRSSSIKNSEFRKLQMQIDKLVYDFLKSHDDIEGAWLIKYAIDDLESLKKYGPECSSCDGELRITDCDYNNIMLSM